MKKHGGFSLRHSIHIVGRRKRNTILFQNKRFLLISYGPMYIIWSVSASRHWR
jgi:hypothetical protein